MPEARIFTSRDFDRFARKARVGDAELIVVVESLEAGSPDASLGGGLVKQRIARENEGKSGGYRTVVVFRKGDRAVFLEGFAKNVKKAHSPDELKRLRATASIVLGLSDAQIAGAIQVGELREIKSDE